MWVLARPANLIGFRDMRVPNLPPASTCGGAPTRASQAQVCGKSVGLGQA